MAAEDSGKKVGHRFLYEQLRSLVPLPAHTPTPSDLHVRSKTLGLKSHYACHTPSGGTGRYYSKPRRSLRSFWRFFFSLPLGNRTLEQTPVHFHCKGEGRREGSAHCVVDHEETQQRPFGPLSHWKRHVRDGRGHQRPTG